MCAVTAEILQRRVVYPAKERNFVMRTGTAEKTPAYRKHKSGQARVTLNGQDVYLGKFGTPESKAKFHETIAQWEANNRLPLKLEKDVTVAELLVAYKAHCEGYYRHADDGSPTGETDNIRVALRALREFHGSLPARDFTPSKLKGLREQMIERGLARTTINKRVNYIRALFKWAVESEAIPAETWHALRAVSALKRGRTEAREPAPVKGVDEDYVNMILPHVSPQIGAMIQIQLLTACRPGEICMMRTGDIERSSEAWTYRPQRHKTGHHGHDREIPIGRNAREILRPFLKLDLSAYIFSPAEAEAWRRDKLSASRRTPLSMGNTVGSNRQASPCVKPGDHYDEKAYARAVQRGCDLAYSPPDHLARAKIKGAKGMRWETRAEWRGRLGADGWAQLKAHWRAARWSPNRLRHSAAEKIERDYGYEVARVVLGHSQINTTKIYAPGDRAKARAAIERIG